LWCVHTEFSYESASERIVKLWSTFAKVINKRQVTLYPTNVVTSQHVRVTSRTSEAVHRNDVASSTPAGSCVAAVRDD